MSALITTPAWADGEVFESLLDQIEGHMERVDADGAYDTRAVYQAASRRDAQLVVPPRENAVSWEDEHPRTKVLVAIAEQGREEWKISTGYHRRSLAENAMYRLKQLLGDRLSSRLLRLKLLKFISAWLL